MAPGNTVTDQGRKWNAFCSPLRNRRDTAMRTDLVQFINQQHGRAFTPVGRYPSGEQGAFAIVEQRSGRSHDYVLKWSQGAVATDQLLASGVTRRLRAAGYPAPRYCLVGVAPPLGLVYSVQETVPGTPLGARLDESLLDRLLELNALQRGQAPSRGADWPQPLVDSVLHGGDGFCLLDPVRSYSTETAALLEVLQGLAATSGSILTSTNDIVHFDFQGANILVDRGAITGVVDWEGCCSGDATFDLATVFFYTDPVGEAARNQHDRLWDLLMARTAPPLLGAYLAHLVLRQLDWSIRFHERAMIAHWLLRSDEVLHRFALATGR